MVTFVFGSSWRSKNKDFLACYLYAKFNFSTFDYYYLLPVLYVVFFEIYFIVNQLVPKIWNQRSICIREDGTLREKVRSMRVKEGLGHAMVSMIEA
jgi:hypothetical protein